MRFQTLAAFSWILPLVSGDTSSGTLSTEITDKDAFAEFNAAESTNAYSTLLGQNFMSGFGKLGPGFITDLKKFIQKSPPKLLSEPTNATPSSLEDAKHVARYAAVAFCPVTKIQNWNCKKWCKEPFEVIQVFENKTQETMAFLGLDHSKKMIVLSYRGSVRFMNWIAHSKYDLVDFPLGANGTKVHEGVYGMLMSLYEPIKHQLEQTLSKPNLKDYRVVFTGMSGGGALAVLAAAQFYPIVSKYGNPAELIGFSGNRVGNEKFVEHMLGLDMKLTRVTTSNDLVPHTPPRSFGYSHIPVEIHHTLAIPLIRRSKTIQCGQRYDEDPECAWKYANSGLGLASHVFIFDQILDFIC